MSNRVSKTVLLCEDRAHESLVIAFLKRCGIRNPARLLESKVASILRKGGNVGWVLEEFPKELRAFRNRQTRAKSLLIVVADADKHPMNERLKQLNESAKASGLEPVNPGESIALLIPKRHVETWIRFLNGETVTEVDECKTSKVLSKDQLRHAADRLYEWSRPNAILDPSCLPSLVEALPAWRMIGDCLR